MGIHKIKTREEIASLIDELRKKNKKIVTTNGTFDILHVGHLDNLFKAKSYGDVLIIGLNSDTSVKQYKSPDRPINSQEDRATLLAALSCVDYITIFDEATPNELLKIIKPDFHVKSGVAFTGVERKTVEENGGKIILLEHVPEKSTTNIIERILKIYKKS